MIAEIKLANDDFEIVEMRAWGEKNIQKLLLGKLSFTKCIII